MVAIELQQVHSRSERRTRYGFGDYFKYHGWLSPGVRLFRSLSFQAKSVWISMAFVAPLLLALYYLWSAGQDQMLVARSERQGLGYSSALVDLVKTAQLRRLAAVTSPAALPDLQEKERAAFEKVAGQQKLLGKDFKLEVAYASVLQQHEQLQRIASASSSEATFAQHAAYVDALLNLTRAVADGSQLSLDPDLDTYHMMNIAVLRGPLLYEMTARLRGVGMMALVGHALTPTQHDLLVEWQGLQKQLASEIQNSFEQGIAGDATAAARFDMAPLAAAAAAQRKALQQQVMGAEITGDSASYLTIANKAASLQLASIEDISRELDTRLEARIARIGATLRNQIGISLLFLALATYFLLAFYRVMMGGLQEVAGHLEQITQGNLTTAPTPWGSDEAAQLMITMGAMQTSLRRIASIVIDSSASVQVASEEIAAAAHDLSARTEDNAANLEETAASMEEISATVRQSNEAIDKASMIVNSNAIAATRGGEVIAQVVSTMQGIQSSSRKIEEIISVIDGIAFQTNILALNAAVEAARAGEQGRGFAVVATEVRNLAHRSATAAKEIKGLINASLEQVNAGAAVAAEAGQTIGSIVDNARKIDALMSEISRASSEQSGGIAQVSSAVAALDQSTQQNAALVEQTTAASATLSDQARQLSHEIAFFKLG